MPQGDKKEEEDDDDDELADGWRPPREPRDNSEQPQAYLLDLKKAYPRVSKPILWKILDKLKMPRSVISKLQDLYEFTEYKVRGHERDSSSFFPQRRLREGYPTSPVIFNIFHQAAMRVATEMRKEKANEKGLDAGIRWSYMPGNSLPPVHKKYTFNSEAKRTDFDLSLLQMTQPLLEITRK